MLAANAPTPVQSFVGGTLLALSLHTFAKLNGSVLGCSGLFHRTVRFNATTSVWKESAAGVTGLVAAGAVATWLGREAPAFVELSVARNLLSGFLVGLGSRLMNGCTSGHFLAGVARGSPRSLVATAVFCATAMLTANFVSPVTTSVLVSDNTLAGSSFALLAAQVVPFSIAAYYLSQPTATAAKPRSRVLSAFTSSLSFGLALLLSNLSNATKVKGFLMTPFSSSFDPSLLFLAAGALPLLATLNLTLRDQRPKLGGPWAIPKPSWDINGRLLAGALAFGVGWGLEGLCPGPGLVNFGAAIARQDSQAIKQTLLWLAAMAVGGLSAL